MLQLKHPGVYTQELPSGVRTITGAPTSVALFLGPTPNGPDGRATRVLSFADYERNFGGLSQTSSLSYSVLHFFANGGGEALVQRVPVANAVAAQTALKRDGAATASVTITALSSGAASGKILVEVDSFDIGAAPFTTTPDKKKFNLTIVDSVSGRVERFTNLSTSSTSARFASTVVNDVSTGSKLVKLDVNGIDQNGPKATGTVYALKALPAAGNFAADIKAKLVVSMRTAAGAVPGTPQVELNNILIYANGTAIPLSKLAAVTALVNAVNAAIRADAAATAAMEGFVIEGETLENSGFLRLRTSATGNANPVARVADATVTIENPGTGTSFLTTFVDTAVSPLTATPGRYQLGLPYTGTEVAGTPVAGADGDASGQPNSTTFKDAVVALETRDPFFNTLCLPDLMRPLATDPTALQHSNATTIYAEAARICEIKHAFLLVDPPPSAVDVGTAESWRMNQLALPPKDAAHAGAYFPNIRVDDPLAPGSIRAHPPSGAVAGIFARTDAQFGVWQAPAGTEAVVAGSYGPSVNLSDKEHGFLNPIGVNVIRNFPIFSTVVFGSRTVAGADVMASEWKYIPVRRTADYILRSLSEGLRWAVQKPNGEVLWSQLRLNVTSFMHGLFRQGAFKGVSAKDAYFVQCDASTTTADDINLGIVNIVVGFAPLKPAEFVVITLRQIVQPSV